MCTTIDPRPSSKLVWPRPPQIRLGFQKRLEFETTSKPSLHWGRRSNQAELAGWADHRDSKVMTLFPTAAIDLERDKLKFIEGVAKLFPCTIDRRRKGIGNASRDAISIVRVTSYLVSMGELRYKIITSG